MNTDRIKGKAPSSVVRVDSGDPNIPEKPHVHFSDGRELNDDKTWRGGRSRALTNKEKEWLKGHGWPLP